MDDFDCDKTAAVVCADWEQQDEKLMKRYNDLMDRLPSDGSYKKNFRKTFAYYLDMKTNARKQLKQEQFDEIGQAFQKTYDEMRDKIDKEKSALAAQALAA